MEIPNYPPEVTYVRNASLKEVIDGDTLEVLIDDGRGSFGLERLRLAWVDTPETRGVEKVAGKYVFSQSLRWFGEAPDDWIILERERLRESHLELLGHLLGEYKRRGDFAQALKRIREIP